MPDPFMGAFQSTKADLPSAAETIQALLNQLKLMNLNPTAGVFLCSGPDLKVRYMDPVLEPLFGDSVTSLHNLVPAESRALHRQIVERMGPKLPDSLRHPMRRIPLVSKRGTVWANLSIGRFGVDLFYVVVQLVADRSADRPERAYIGEDAARQFVDYGMVPEPETFAVATVLCVDVVNFCRQCKRRSLVSLGEWMSSIHAVVDGLLEQYAVRKIETRGDCVICVTGTNYIDGGRDLWADQATRMMDFASDLGLRLSNLPDDDGPTDVRIGIATGDIVLMHILHDGDPLPMRYIFGDTVNLAARLEQTGTVGAIHLSESTVARYLAERRNAIAPNMMSAQPVKGMGLVRSALFSYRTRRWLVSALGAEDRAWISSGL